MIPCLGRPFIAVDTTEVCLRVLSQVSNGLRHQLIVVKIIRSQRRRKPVVYSGLSSLEDGIRLQMQPYTLSLHWSRTSVGSLSISKHATLTLRTAWLSARFDCSRQA